MPTFYVHLARADEGFSDVDGLEFPDLDAVVRDCERAAGELVVERAQGEPWPGQEFRIYDGEGRLLRTIPIPQNPQ